MRTLLVDNYDSFTYNLFHYLAEVDGDEPVVVRNDDPRWRTERLEEFGKVVLSPGPGTPARDADFGICREIVERGRLPLLGVCLGHQGLALSHGGTVERAPEPRHGRTSPVLHGGGGLFSGLPSPFEAVRYHSLAVTELPEALEATAWTPDGVLMGLRHRRRPLWGVQFHPESVSTEHGHRLLANFARLSERHNLRAGRVGPRRTARAAAPAGRPAAAAAPRGRLRILVESMPTRWGDEAAFERLFRGGDHAFWLDSSRPDSGLGRFSVMGDASGPLARVAKADVWRGTVTVRSARTTRIVAGRFLDWLEEDLRTGRVDPADLPPGLPFDFALGWVGYLGYELKAECGGERVHRSEEPDAAMVFADRAVLLDHAGSTTYLLALVEDGDEASARDWMRSTADRLSELPDPSMTSYEEPGPVPGPGLGLGLGELVLRHDRDRYLGLIADCQDQIAAGESYEVCLTNMAELRGRLDPWHAYRYLRRTSPAPFAALLQFDKVHVLSTSPERFLRVDRDGTMESKPIKGTRPRGATPAEDAALAADLLSDEKDRSENLMIVDLVRNDLGRCARVGSVEADEVFAVESYATVHQLVSTVRARMREDTSTVACVRAAFPGGSMTGAPKVRTMGIIDRLEDGPRGVYSGAIGYLSLTGTADLSIVIRTAVVTPNRVRYGIGGAIVALSDPEAEFEETAVKAAPLLALADAPFPGRTERSLSA
ncbi:aminodeoxychorismate synthase component I [Wenjunlia tyrosinilytica]|uniref:Aminodeoxychorismate synthase n=1 Tax=Wenjunlia tyrosinilytica TaxID=1544741 RepID=A0A917ZQ95_9ACTN|nr:aminodeoxychorismate synthase component I [Wenjunlia tyrosinilytica]GGO88633.1 aminodeoxychorismate synthase, component I [Wenjunlia tyrosinilytica]